MKDKQIVIFDFGEKADFTRLQYRTLGNGFAPIVIVEEPPQKIDLAIAIKSMNLDLGLEITVPRSKPCFTRRKKPNL